MGEAFVTQVDGCRHEAVAIRGDPPAARARHLGNEPIGVKAREQTERLMATALAGDDIVLFDNNGARALARRARRLPQSQ
jgi:hypothetical protein